MADTGEELGKAAANVVSEVYKDGAQDGVKQIGSAIGTVFELLTRWKYYIMLGNEKSRLNFEQKKEMLRISFAGIPEQKVIEVLPEFSVPLLEKISYTSNEDIAKLFINLLTMAANEDTAGDAHPKFITMIESLSTDEAKIINYLVGKKEILYVNINILKNINNAFSNSHHSIIKHITELESIDLTFPENIRVYLNNLESLGIIIDQYPDSKAVENQYDNLKQLYKTDFEIVKSSYNQADPNCKVDWDESFFEITPLGKMFIDACTNNCIPRIVGIAKNGIMKKSRK